MSCGSLAVQGPTHCLACPILGVFNTKVLAILSTTSSLSQTGSWSSEDKMVRYNLRNWEILDLDGQSVGSSLGRVLGVLGSNQGKGRNLSSLRPSLGLGWMLH